MKPKFKPGDVLFISDLKFEDKSTFVNHTGFLYTIKEIKTGATTYHCETWGAYTGSTWSFDSAHKSLKKYNKKNWCEVFERFMSIHKDEEFKKLTDPLIKFCNDSGNPYTKIIVDIDSAEIITTERRTINKEFYRD